METSGKSEINFLITRKVKEIIILRELGSEDAKMILLLRLE